MIRLWTFCNQLHTRIVIISIIIIFENRNTVCVFVWYARDKLTRCAACQFHIDIDCSICRNFSLWQKWYIRRYDALFNFHLFIFCVCIVYASMTMMTAGISLHPLPFRHLSDCFLGPAIEKKKHIKQQRIRNGRNDDDDNILVIRNWNAHVWLCSIPENILRFQISHFHSISFVGISTYQT